MIFVVEAIGRRWCARFAQSTAPVFASTRIAAGAAIGPRPACSSLGAAGSSRRVPGANGARAATCCSEATARNRSRVRAETGFGVSIAVACLW